MYADVNESTKAATLCNHAFEDHVWTQIFDFFRAPSLNVAVVNSGRARIAAWFSNSFKMSVMVGTTEFSSAYLAGDTPFKAELSPMTDFTSLISAKSFQPG